MAAGDDLAVEVKRYCLTFPESTEDFPWGDTVYKVRGKVFVFAGFTKEKVFGISVKLPQSALDVLQRPYASPTGYGLGKSGWVSIQLSQKGGPAIAEVHAWIVESWRAVAPKKLIKAHLGK